MAALLPILVHLRKGARARQTGYGDGHFRRRWGFQRWEGQGPEANFAEEVYAVAHQSLQRQSAKLLSSSFWGAEEFVVEFLEQP